MPRESTAFKFSVVGAQLYATPVDLNLNNIAMPAAPGVTSNPIFVEGYTSFSCYFLATQAGQLFVVAMDENDVSDLALVQVDGNFAASGTYQVLSFGGTGNLPAQVWRSIKLRFQATGAAGNVTARLFGRG